MTLELVSVEENQCSLLESELLARAGFTILTPLTLTPGTRGSLEPPGGQRRRVNVALHSLCASPE